MQFNLALTASAGHTPEDPMRRGLLPLLVQLLPVTPSQVELEVEAARRTAARQRRRDDLVHDVLAAARPSELAIDAERKMLPGSHALRQVEQEVHAQARELRTSRSFRQTLDRTRPGSPREAASAKSATPRPAPEASDVKPGNMPPARSPARETAAPPPTLPDAAGTSARSGAARLPSGLWTPPPQDRPTLAEGSRRATRNGGTASLQAASSLGAMRAPHATRSTGESARPTSPPVDLGAAGRGAGGVRRLVVARPALTEAPPRGNSDANVARMLRLIHTRLGPERSVATLRLDPPELGMVRLRMDLRADQLALTIETERPEARRLLSEQLDALRQGLESSGIQLHRVELRLAELAAGGAESDTSSQAGVDPGDQEASPRSDDGGTSSEEQESGTEAARVDSIGASSPALTQGSVTESLVNVLA